MLTKIIAAIGSALLVLGLEWSVVTWRAQRQLTSTWELTYGTLWLLPSAVLYVVPIAIAAALGWALFEHARENRRARIILAVSCGTLAALLAFSVTQGRHFEDPLRRSGFIGIVLLVTALIVAATAPLVARTIQRAPVLFSLHVLGIGIGLELLNRFVLVRLYPGFHGALAILVLLLAPGLRYGIVELLAIPSSEPRRRRFFPAIGLAICLGACAVLLVPFTERLNRLDNFRLMLLEEAPILGKTVTLNARWFPSQAKAGDADCVGTACNETSPTAGSTLDLTGRDILLITIDALRADHVGSYGYARRTTPSIDALAAQGVQLDYAYCPTPHTSYSITSLLTGKYMRPLLLQGLGEDSPTLANILRTYGYKTAAFYPPAIFFIDNDRFKAFESSGLGFEYRKVEFSEGANRIHQVRDYLKRADKTAPLFLWVHLFGPHEPYELHPEHDFGPHDLDRYDSEIAAADQTARELVASVRQRSPNAVVIVSADHGEEFGDHGGHYHGSSVYEEQARVPFVISIPDLLKPRRVKSPVQTIDLFPTLLAALKIPVSPRVRGRDLSGLLTGEDERFAGFAFAETDEMTLIAERQMRLVCQRKLGACKLFDLEVDPRQQVDATPRHRELADRLRANLRRINATHGEHERQEPGQGGRSWPAAILRGIAGDADAAEDLASLLDDADVEVRRKAAELLFRLKARSAADALRLALRRDEDLVVQRYAAVGLQRFGETTPLAHELLHADAREWRRLSALVLAENGDPRGSKELIAWWSDDGTRDFEVARDLLAAFAKIRARDAVAELSSALGDVRLKPYIARTLSAIGDPAARDALRSTLAEERYQGTRGALAEALVQLGARTELIEPLRRFLGVPDPLSGGVELALRAGIADQLGGLSNADQAKLAATATRGALVSVELAPGGNGRGSRVLIRAQNTTQEPRRIWVGPLINQRKYIKSNNLTMHNLSEITNSNLLEIEFSPSSAQEVAALVPGPMALLPLQGAEWLVLAEPGLEVQGMLVVPLSDELPPPAPKPWQPQTTPDAGTE